MSQAAIATTATATPPREYVKSSPTTSPYTNTVPAARNQCGCTRRAASHNASGSPITSSSASAFQYPTGALSRAIRPDPSKAGTAFPNSVHPSASATIPARTYAHTRNAPGTAPSASPITASARYTSPRFR